jgi:hypothetical protein
MPDTFHPNLPSYAPDHPHVLVMSAYARLFMRPQGATPCALIAAFGDCAVYLLETQDETLSPRYWIELHANGEPVDGIGRLELAKAVQAAGDLLHDAKIINSKIAFRHSNAGGN